MRNTPLKAKKSSTGNVDSSRSRERFAKPFDHTIDIPQRSRCDFSGRLAALIAALICLPCLQTGYAERVRTLPIPSDSSDAIIVAFTGDEGESLQRYVRRSRETDIRAVISRYLDSLGYFRAARIEKRDTTVVHAGTRAVLSEIDYVVRGGQPHDSGIAADLRLPMPYDAGLLNRLAASSVRDFAENGYPFAASSITIDSSYATDGDTLRIEAIISVRPGKKYHFAPPLLKNGFTTKPRILRYDLAFTPGMVFDIRRLERSERRLESRDYIQSIGIGSPLIVPPGEEMDTVAAEEHGTVVVPIRIEDHSGLGVDGVLGYQSSGDAPNRLTGLLSLSLLNTFHVGEQITVAYTGENEYSELDVFASKPHVFGLPLTISGSFGLEISETPESRYAFVEGMLRGMTEIRDLWSIGTGLRIYETTGDTGGISESSQFYGVDVIAERRAETRVRGESARRISFTTGTGIATKSAERHNRFRFEFSGGIQIPVFGSQAIAPRFDAKSLITNRDDELLDVEKFRIGGYRSLRGYAENEFTFKSVTYAQLDYLFYFSRTGAVYLFADAGVGFPEEISFSRDARTSLFGYGTGITIPVRIGTLSLEYARSLQDRRNLGRINIQIRNSSAGREKW